MPKDSPEVPYAETISKTKTTRGCQHIEMINTVAQGSQMAKMVNQDAFSVFLN
jgi:hypothetical protein